MMYNLKKEGGTFKGLIGESMFKLTRKYAFLVRFHNKKKFFEIYENILSSEQKSFLDQNWYSLDSIEVIGNEIFLYEIKTRNKYQKLIHFKPKMTLETHNLYNEAKKCGFLTKIATVWLLDDWNYNVEITDFEENFYCIDKPKRYDKVRG